MCDIPSKAVARRAWALAIVGALFLGALAASPIRAAQTPPAGFPGAGDWVQKIADLLADLNLSDVQKQEIKAVFQDHGEALAAVATCETQSRKALMDVIHSPSVDGPAIRQASASVALADVQLDLQRAEIYAETYSILTPDQRATLKSFLDEANTLVGDKVQAFLANWDGTLPPPPGIGPDVLDLSADQKAQIRSVFQAEKPQLTIVLQREKAARKSLQSAIRQPSVNEAGVRRASALVAQCDLSLSMERAKIYSGVYNVLTDEQRAQLAQIISQVQDRVAGRIEAVVNLLEQLFG